MSEQPRKPLTLHAMQYGLYMGLYLLIAFLFSAWSLHAPVFNTLAVLTVVAIARGRLSSHEPLHAQ